MIFVKIEYVFDSNYFLQKSIIFINERINCRKLNDIAANIFMFCDCFKKEKKNGNL